MGLGALTWYRAHVAASRTEASGSSSALTRASPVAEPTEPAPASCQAAAARWSASGEASSAVRCSIDAFGLGSGISTGRGGLLAQAASTRTLAMTTTRVFMASLSDDASAAECCDLLVGEPEQPAEHLAVVGA